MNLFDPNFAERFQLFTTSHVTTMIVIAVLWIVIPWRFKGQKDNRSDRLFRYVLGSVLVSCSLGFTLWEVVTGRFSLDTSLPLNLCDLTNYLCAILLFRPRFKLFEIIYFWGLAGSIQSFVTPNITFAFPHFEFFAFYIQHGGEFLTILYITVVTGYHPTVRSLGKSLGVLCGYVVFVYGVNLLIDANYMFLMADTPQPSAVTKMIQLFGDPPRHIIGLGLIAMVSYGVLYAPFMIKNLIGKRSFPAR